MSVAETLTRLRQLLSAMEMVSEAPAAKMIDSPVSGSKSEGRVPRSAGDSLVDEWLTLLNALCQAGELNLEWYKHRPPGKNLDKIDRQKRILSAYEGHPPIFVAFVEGVSEDHVRRLRRRNNLRIENGLPHLSGEEDK